MRKPAALLIALVLSGAGIVSGGTANALADWEPPVPVDVTPVPVEDQTRRTVVETAQPPRVKGPSTIVWPADTAAQITPGARAAAGQAVSVAAAASVGRVGVRVYGRAAAETAGISGVMMSVARSDGQRSTGTVGVNLDYSGFAGAFGGDWASRLRLVRLPACALTTPGAKGCGLDAAVPVDGKNDAATQTLTADVALPAAGAPQLLAAAAAPAGPNGDYKATSLTPASTWQVSQQTGAFSWKYPIKSPPAVGGPTPSLAFSYSSQAVDGKTSGQNGQGSWVGDGWDMWTGFIERTYKSCLDDTKAVGGKDPNNKDKKTGDQCWWKPNATMSLNGSSTELIDLGGGKWKGTGDDGSRVELLDDASNGVYDGEHWKVTTIDGAQYFFGRRTDSAWTTQVYGNHPGDPGYESGDFAGSRETQAWRWNLDYVVDPHGNTMTLNYGKETGAYGREFDADKRQTYDRGGYLTTIDYGTRTDQSTASARIAFDVADRCLAGATCFDSNGKAVAASWPDVPWDQYCRDKCTEQMSPTFWTQKRLSAVRAQVRDGSGFRTVESWTLKHSWLNAGVSQNEGVPMWLDSITHSGSGIKGGTAVTDPAVTFSPGADPFPNRVDGANDGRTALNRFRIVSITTETGAQIGVTYLPSDCTRSALPAVHANGKRCFPQWATQDGTDPTLDWFNKYVVKRIDLYDNGGGFTHEQTNYDYLDTPMWKYDDSELVEEKKRTWGQWRGYGHVRVRNGLETGPQSVSEYRYFRGMDGDKQPDDKVRDVWVKDSLDGTGDAHSKRIEDHDAYQGQLREQTTFDGVGGQWITGKLTEPGFTQTGASGALKAYMVHTPVQLTRTRLADGTTQWSKVLTKVNAENLPTEVSDLGDEATAADDQCTKTSYVHNGTLWIKDKVLQTDQYGVACATTPSIPGDVIMQERNYYDDLSKPLGTAPTRGLVVKEEELKGWSGTTPQWFAVTTTTYDANGRATSATDSLNRTTKTQYVPDKAGPVTEVKTTNALDHTASSLMEAAWQVPTTVTDAGGRKTELEYDGAGRLTKVWLPGRAKSEAANILYAYKVRNTAPSVTTTKKLLPDGTGRYQTSTVLFDALLRQRQAQSQAVGGGRVIADTVYDSRGLVAWSSDPYYHDTSGPGEAIAVPTKAIPSVTENTYDGAGRLTKAEFKAYGVAKWATTTAYTGTGTVVTPPIGGTKTETVQDARGRTVELRQFHSFTAATYDRTRYAYTDKGDLASITDQAGNVWRNTYDVRGNKVKLEDPDKGVSEQTFDTAGQLTGVKDARGVVLAYTYDPLGRKTTLREGSATGPLRSEWLYDTATGGLGKPAGSIRYNGSAKYSTLISGYDAGGYATGMTVTLPAETGALAKTYEYKTTYKQDGQPATLTLPAVGNLPEEKLEYGYNAVGKQSYIKSGLQIYVNDTVYNQIGGRIQRILGQDDKRVWQTETFDEPTGRLVTSSTTPELKNQTANFNYEYDQMGSVTKVSDRPNGGQQADHQCFTTDHLRRMTEAWTPVNGDCAPAARSAATLGGPAPYWHSYAYTTTGSRDTETWRTATTTTVRDFVQPAQGGAAGSRPHAVTRVDKSTGGSDSYAYDEAGNMNARTVNGAATTLTWDAEGDLATTVQNGQTTSYLYDAEGARLIRKEPGAITAYLPHGQEVKAVGTTVTGTRYYLQGDDTVAVRTGTGLTGLAWLAQDHHNTAEAMIKAADLTATRKRSLPFGAQRGGNPAFWAGEKGFVGGTNDPTGLVNIGARDYDPLLGAFISVDPVIDPLDPQQMHGYSYSNGNPLTFTDPDGLLFGIKKPAWMDKVTNVAKAVAVTAINHQVNVVKGAGKFLWEHSGKISAVTGYAAMAAAVIPGGQPFAAVLGAVSTVTGVIDTVKSCKEGKKVDCAVGAAGLVPIVGKALANGPAKNAAKKAIREADSRIQARRQDVTIDEAVMGHAKPGMKVDIEAERLYQNRLKMIQAQKDRERALAAQARARARDRAWDNWGTALNVENGFNEACKYARGCYEREVYAPVVVRTVTAPVRRFRIPPQFLW
ncbi:RHS repeat-associated core domain-containing protein [Herbidospora daliensis]|uniref:RHS repeat-associated core domain-containing protein n=1 Tax=Herbidospora daliensis TaxID=295585 RepID=UPI000783581A|nr:RHS repeat-associated core domain-containing protein [Herbidospora daliensis]